MIRRGMNRRDLFKVSLAGAGVYVAGRYFIGVSLAAPPPLEK